MRIVSAECICQDVYHRSRLLWNRMPRNLICYRLGGDNCFATDTVFHNFQAENNDWYLYTIVSIRKTMGYETTVSMMYFNREIKIYCLAELNCKFELGDNVRIPQSPSWRLLASSVMVGKSFSITSPWCQEYTILINNCMCVAIA